MKRVLAVTLSVICLFAVCAFSIAYAVDNSNNEVILSSSSSGGAYTDFNSALSAVSDGGTITVSGTFSLPTNFSWRSHGKSVTVTGGTLSASSLVLGDNVVFDNMTLNISSGGALYANGYKLCINENVTVSNVITVYGGGNGTTVNSTDVTLLSGTYDKIYGGGNGGKVLGDTYLTVGGSANSTIDEKNHSLKYNIFGGGLNDRIEGSVNLVFTGNAKASYIYGGSNGASSVINGDTNVNISGGKAMSCYGGNAGVDTKSDVYLTMTGGELEQLFGANGGSNAECNVYLSLIGGKITRRIYGGCYNEVQSSNFSFNWKTSYYVKGKITLVIGEGLSVTYDATEPGTTTKYSDRSIYARSRYKLANESEKSSLVFIGTTAQTNNKDKLKATDTEMKLVMMMSGANFTEADETHVVTYAADTATRTITETCSSCATSHTATATLSLDPSVSLVENGSPIRAALLSVTGEWTGMPPRITYEDNLSYGTARAVSSCGGAEVYLEYEIEAAPVITTEPETEPAPVITTEPETEPKTEVSSEVDTDTEVTNDPISDQKERDTETAGESANTQTTSASDTATESNAETEENKKSGGCSSSLSYAPATLAVIALAVSGFALKKKREN